MCSILLAVVSAAFDPDAAIDWALKCTYGCSECPEKSCSSTEFTTKAFSHGNWGYPEETECSTLYSNFRSGHYPGWTFVNIDGSTHNMLRSGDVVFMNDGKNGEASLCCISTSAGLVTCHTPDHQNVKPSETWENHRGNVDAVYHYSASWTNSTSV
jgi:hypothetical protein